MKLRYQSFTKHAADLNNLWVLI